MKNLEELMTQGRIRRESRRDEFVRKSLLSDEFLDLIQKNKKPFDLMMSYYQCVIMEIETKFRVLDQEYSLEYDKNPIEAIKSRVKSPESLAKKIRRKNIPMSLTSIEENIKDIAGVRVICSFPDDIYELEESFLKQDDIVLIERKDYIKNPKPSGYRSLHLIVQVPMPFRVRSLTTACRRYVTSCLTELPAFCFFADFYKLLILSFLTYQFFMCTTFSDLAIRYNQDLVCLLDRGKAVCDGDDGFPSGKFCYGSDVHFPGQHLRSPHPEISGIHLLKISKRNSFQCITDSQPVSGDQFITDGLLKFRSEIIKEKSKEDQHANGIGSYHNGHGCKNIGKE